VVAAAARSAQTCVYRGVTEDPWNMDEAFHVHSLQHAETVEWVLDAADAPAE
jgi:hypothetical protein